jgi:hypothetical protein
MPNKTIAHGCSFTRYAWPCWPAFVPWFNGGITMLNKGRSGSGNETISRAAINSAIKHTQIDHMYIMWSGTDRYEVITKDKGEDDVKGRATYYVWDEDLQWSTWYGGHPEKDKHEYYRRHFWNIEHQYYRTLEHIHRTQLVLDKKQIPYTMMIFNKDVLRDSFYSESERALYNQIDWTKFLFYKEKSGLWEFAEENYKQFYIPNESHPPPIAHYHWVKDIMFKSNILCPQEEYNKLKDYFKGKNGRS